MRHALRAFVLVLGGSLLLGGAARAEEKLPEGARLVKIEAQPTSITIKNPFEYAQVVLTGQLENGERIDVTRMVKIEALDTVVKVSPTAQVRPVADGAAEIKVSLAGQSLSIPVKVSGQKEKYPVSFVRDVMPTLSRVGCNAGTCHGSAEGKNGFKLSLRGYDPILDHRSLTDDLEGRRFNRAAPETSLMLLKTSGAVPHVGGALMKPGEPYYELLRTWIGAGVKIDLNSPRVTSVDVLPKGSVIPLPGMKQQVAVYATFADGTVRDVTSEAFIESSNTEIATTDRQGTVTAIRRGEANVMVRYEGSYAATTLVVMGNRTGFAWNSPPEFNYIDTLVYEKLRQVKVQAADVCNDSDFIRRLYLDLTGLPPNLEQVRAFLADKRPQREKRDALVDQLVGSPEFIEYWTNKWADLLQVNRKFLGDEGAIAFRNYIHDAVVRNKPYDKFVYDILTASGSNFEHPAASYYKVLRDPEGAMENTTQLFLATRFNCNKCHDHPFERWTQDQYYQMSAFFAQIERKEDPNFKGKKVGGTNVEAATPLIEIIGDLKAGEVKHLRTGAVAPPKFPYLVKDVAAPTETRRVQLARWVTSKDNPYFARSYVNRLWAYMLGVGIIEPIDDIRSGNPATNPKLLDKLTTEFIASNFNAQEMMRTICKSRVYQHSMATTQWNKDDDINYSHAIARRLPAEVLYDAIHRATGSVSHLPGLPAGARATQLLDSTIDVPGGFLGLFGKPPRESACECERTESMMLGPVLTMVNGPVVGDAIRDPNNRIHKLLTSEKDTGKVIDELYLAVLCRLPNAKEKAAAEQIIKDGEQDFAMLVKEYEGHAAAVTAYEKTLPDKQAKWEADLNNKPEWTTLDLATMTSKEGATLTKQADGSILVSDKKALTDTYTIAAKTSLKDVTAIRLELLPDPSLPAQGPGRAGNGNLVLNYFEVKEKEEGAKGDPKQVQLTAGKADFAQDLFPLANALLNQQAAGWAISPQFGKAHSGYFLFKTPLKTAKDTELTITLVQKYGGEHTIGKFRLSVTTTKVPFADVPPPEPLAKIFAVEPAKRTPEEKAELTRYYREQDMELKRLQQVVADFGKPVDKRQPGTQDLVWALINSKAFQFNH